MAEQRNTRQYLLPLKRPPLEQGRYDIYPAHQITEGQVWLGFRALAKTLAEQPIVIMDGYAGVFWEDVVSQLAEIFSMLGKRVHWCNVLPALKSEAEIHELLTPFLGGDDPVFGRRYVGGLADFFCQAALSQLTADAHADVTILYGPGAALAGWQGYLVYLDVPKNELQFRARAGQSINLTVTAALPPKQAYKRAYFIDWIVLNQHKKRLLPEIDLMVDTQRADIPVFCSGETLRKSLTEMSTNYFRVRPWFEPGAWGGQWIKETIPQLATDVPNYAWSFELITPENGLLLQHEDTLLEVSFDLLMYHAGEAVLGDAHPRFQDDFPIRFDFLDTFKGGNLSVQCHPSPAYIQKHFGEPFTQDETYYILDAAENATVYLGFQADIEPQVFQDALEYSQINAVSIDIERYVQKHPAKKHDLFLIPHGTIHSAGAGSLVLEISATPYIFTFKMYDWLRLDLDGKPRPLNIERGVDNLRFERQGEAVRSLISQPQLADSGVDYRIYRLPTHPDHFYEVRRLEFDSSLRQQTNRQCHIMNLVEGSAIRLETAAGQSTVVNYAETFVVPAAAGLYRLINLGKSPAKVVQAYVRSGA